MGRRFQVPSIAISFLTSKSKQWVALSTRSQLFILGMFLKLLIQSD